jgi:hypothetical protein
VSCPVASNLIVTSITGSSAELAWDDVADALRYKVHYKVAATSEWTKVTDVKSNKKVISGLTPNTSYVWQVKSVCSANPILASGWSDKQSFTTGAIRMGDEQSRSFELYPNPATENFTLYLELLRGSAYRQFNHRSSAAIFMLNALGQIVYTSEELTVNMV